MLFVVSQALQVVGMLRVMLFISICYRDLLGLLHVSSKDNVGEFNHDNLLQLKLWWNNN
jgi:hypothetical protein